MKSYTAEWREIIEPIFQKTINQPFIKELMNGTLAIEKFQFYLMQDSIYLITYSEAMKNVAAKLNDANDSEFFMNVANEGVAMEQYLHETYFKQFQVVPTNIASPTCNDYLNFLKSKTALEHAGIGLAAVLPCFKIYLDVGNYIYKTSKIEGNPFQTWIEAYNTELFVEEVNQACSITDKVAATVDETTRQKMFEAFRHACWLEYRFWESAYRLEDYR